MTESTTDKKAKPEPAKPPAKPPVQKGMGFTDFGAGSATVLTSKCLRKTEVPTECTFCLEGCPTNALALKNDLIKASDACLRCGVCTELCPTTAISTMRETIQKLSRRLLDVCYKNPRMIITCERTMTMMRMRAKEDGHEAIDDENFKQLEDAKNKNLIHVVPCLGMMGPELWFALINEIGSTMLKQVEVLLPLGQCEECPVNAAGIVEQLFEEAISTAERWSGISIGLLGTVAELSAKPASLLTPLKKVTSEDTELDRREAFTGAFKSLRSVWDSAVEAAEVEAAAKMTAAEEAVLRRKRRDAYKNTLLGQRINNQPAATSLLTSSSPQPLTVMKTAKVTPKRYMLVEALGNDPKHAETVVLTVSATDEARCLGCEQCVKACALAARKLGEDQKASVDTLACLGCGVCNDVCPESACSLTTVTGSSFLL